MKDIFRNRPIKPCLSVSKSPGPWVASVSECQLEQLPVCYWTKEHLWRPVGHLAPREGESCAHNWLYPMHFAEYSPVTMSKV